jgi:pimeloyl-ACP methyl ester carboxylesterase
VGSYILLPGAGGSPWYWSRVVPLLEAAGHEAIAVDLPGADPEAGLPEYTRIALEAIGDRKEYVLAAQSLGGFTAPLVAAAASPRTLVLVNAMIPVPGETAGAWWDDTGWLAARTAAAEAGGYPTEFELGAYFLHDVPPEVAEEGAPHARPEADAAFLSTCGFDGWPASLRVVAGADDRFFPTDFQRRVARERVGVKTDVLPGGHLIAVARPRELADYLLRL